LENQDGRPVCVDIDECEKGYCQGGQCINSPNSFKCLCPDGFDISLDGKVCSDKDECTLSGMCSNGICINMNGSFKCQCKNGYKLSNTGRACIDIDECHENVRICLNGRCENTGGSYKCHCDNGFTLSEDGAFCIDLDECSSTGCIIFNESVKKLLSIEMLQECAITGSASTSKGLSNACATPDIESDPIASIASISTNASIILA
jgi:hypothetical protein